MDHLLKVIAEISNWLWGPPLLILLVGGGIYLTVRLGFFQFRYFPYIMKQTFGSMMKKGDGEGSVSPFQAATTALASTVGASNIVGVPVAIAFGGPGAVFWMWIVSLIGAASKFTEIVLGIKYREKNEDGVYVGGPMYYLSKGLKWKTFGKALAFIYAFGTMFGLFASVAAQSVSAVQTIEVMGVDPLVTGSILTVAIGIIAYGGIKRISGVSEKLVPFMAVLYIVGALIVIGFNIANVPGVLVLIVKTAFTGTAMTGGFAGAGVAAAIRWGLARGTYSCEAGMGSAPMAHSAATTDHAVRQGFWGVFEITVAGLIICTMTALIVLTTGVWTEVPMEAAASMPTVAFQSVMGDLAGGILVSVSMLLFVISTIIVLVYYGEKQCEYFFGTKAAKLLKLVYVLAIFLGATGGIEFIFQFLDLIMACTILPNMIGILLMSGQVAALKKEFFSDPRYYLKDIQK